MPIKANVTRAYGDIFFFLLLRIFFFFFDVDLLSFIGFVTILLLFYV